MKSLCSNHTHSSWFGSAIKRAPAAPRATSADFCEEAWSAQGRRKAMELPTQSLVVDGRPLSGSHEPTSAVGVDGYAIIVGRMKWNSC